MAFSAVMLERFQKRRFQGLPDQPDGVGLAGSYTSGRFVAIAIRFKDGSIAEAGFRSYNCLPAIAAADWVCEAVHGVSADEALSVTVQDVIEALGGLPVSRLFCAQMACDALHSAISEAQRKGRIS